MTDQEILGKVREVFQDLFELQPSEVTLATSQESVEAWDSLQHLNVALALEEVFSVAFSPEEMERLVSVEQIVQMLKGKLDGSRTPA